MLTDDKKLPSLNVLALKSAHSSGKVPEELILSLLDPGKFKNLRGKHEKFYISLVKLLLGDHLQSERVVSKVTQNLATQRDAKDIQSAMSFASKCASAGEGDGSVTKLVSKHLCDALKDLKTSKKASKTKKARHMVRVALSALRLAVAAEAGGAAAIDEATAEELLACLVDGGGDPGRAMAGHAVVVCEALIGRGDMQEALYRRLESSAASTTEDTSFRTDLCRLVGRCLESHYAGDGGDTSNGGDNSNGSDDGDGGAENPQVGLCRKLLASYASDKDIQVLLEAVKQLACETCVGELGSGSSTEERERTRRACRRSWAHLCRADGGQLLPAVTGKLEALLSSSERDLQTCCICAAVTSLFKCATLARGGEGDGFGSDFGSGTAAAPLGLVPILRGLMNTATSVNLLFILAKCLLWGGGLGAGGACVDRAELAARLGAGGVPLFLVHDLILEVALFLDFAADGQVGGVLLLLCSLAGSLPTGEAVAHVEAAWKKCMQRPQQAKAAAITSALDTLSPSSNQIHPEAMRAASVDFLAEYLNFAFEEYQWARGEGAGEGAGGNPLMLAALDTCQEALLSASPGLRRKLVSAIQTIAIRSGDPYQRRCYLILKKASLETTSASRQGAGQAVGLLEEMFTLQSQFTAQAASLGAAPSQWPAQEVARIRALHSGLVEALSSVCFIPKHLYLPLGSGSKAFLAATEKP